jgi:hypothetical protein
VDPGVDPGADPGADPGTAEPGSGGSTSTDAAVKAALDEWKQAFDDRQAAYAAGDLVAAAEADKRMQTAIEKALAAAG